MLKTNETFKVPISSKKNLLSSDSIKGFKEKNILAALVEKSTLSVVNNNKETDLSYSDLFDQKSPNHFLTKTYLQPYYFSNIKTETSSPSYLIKERKFEEELNYENPQLLFGIRHHLSPIGSLKQNAQGLIYLDVSDDYIHKLYPFFAENGAEKPPMQAHIPIISPEEWMMIDQEKTKDLGSEISFTVEHCKRISPSNWPEMEYVWILTLKSERLEEFRKSYGLTPKLHLQPFTILLAVKPYQGIIQSKEPSLYHFKVNPASCAV